MFVNLDDELKHIGQSRANSSRRYASEKSTKSSIRSNDTSAPHPMTSRFYTPASARRMKLYNNLAKPTNSAPVGSSI